jgi:hypothetical protein
MSNATMYLFKHLLLLVDLLKGKGHKYIKRVPVGVDKKTGRTRYRYVYNVTHKVHGKHIDDHDNMKVNSKYMFHSEAGEEVHVHVKKVNKDGSLVLMYDDGDKKGEEFTMTKKELAQKLREEHGIEEKFKEKREKVKRDLEIARKKGTDKQIKRLERELASLERGSEEEKKKGKKEVETEGNKEGLNDFIQASLEVANELIQLKEDPHKSRRQLGARYEGKLEELKFKLEELERIRTKEYDGELPVEEQVLFALASSEDRKKSIKTVEALMKKAQPLLDSLKKYGSEAKVNTPFERYDADAPPASVQDFYNFIKSITESTQAKLNSKRFHSDRAVVYGDGTVIRAHNFAITEGKLNIEGLSGNRTEPVGFIYSSDTIKQIKETIDAYKGMQGFEEVGDKLDALKDKFKAGQFYTFKDYDDMWKEATGDFTDGRFGETANLKRALEVFRPTVESLVKRSNMFSEDFFSIGGRDKSELIKRLQALKSIGDTPIQMLQKGNNIEIVHPQFKPPLMVVKNEGGSEVNDMTVTIDYLISALQSNKKTVSLSQQRLRKTSQVFADQQVEGQRGLFINQGSFSTYIPPRHPPKQTVHR